MDQIECQEYLTRAQVLMQQGQYEAALEQLDGAEQSNRMEQDVYLSKGICYANLDQIQQAEEQFRKALKLNRKNGLAMFHLGNIYMMTGRSQDGLEMYNNAIGCGYKDPQIFFTLGLYFEEEDNVEMALRNYAKAYQTEPTRADARIRRISLLLRTGQLEAALQAIDEMIVFCPDVFEGYHARFMVLMQMGNLEEAEKTIKSAMEMFPSDVGFATDYIKLLLAQGKSQEATAYIEDVQQRMEFSDPEKAELELEKAQIASEKNDLEGTIASLTKAKQLSGKENVELTQKAEFLLANCYMAKSQWEQALAELRLVKSDTYKSEFSAAVLYMEPLVLKQMGSQEEAVKQYREAIKTLRALSMANPGQIDYTIYRIFCHRDIGETEKALDLCDYLGKIAGNIAEVHTARATVLRVMGRNEEAAEEEKIAAQLGGVSQEISEKLNQKQAGNENG